MGLPRARHPICSRTIVSSPLDKPVLVLNRLWQPVHVCPVKRAIGLLFLGHAEVVHVHGENDIRTHAVEAWLEISREPRWKVHDLVHSPSLQLAAPRVIVVATYDRVPRKEIRFTRENVFQRDGYICQYCGIQFEPRQLNIDHVIPRDKGGPTTWDNVVTSCVACNSRKGNKLPHQARMEPLRKPRPPRWRPLAGHLRRGTLFHAEWAQFIELPQDRVRVG